MGLFSDIEKQYSTRQQVGSSPGATSGGSIFDTVEHVGADNYLQQAQDDQKKRQAAQDALNARLTQRKTQIQAAQQNMQSTSNPGGLAGVGKALAEGGYDFNTAVAKTIAPMLIRSGQTVANIAAANPLASSQVKQGAQTFNKFDPNFLNKIIADQPTNDTQGRSRILQTTGGVAANIAASMPVTKAIGAAEDVTRGTQLVQGLANGGRIAQAGASIIPRVAGSVTGAAGMAAQDHLQGNDANIGKDVALGVGLDVVPPVVGKALSKMASFGKAADTIAPEATRIVPAASVISDRSAMVEKAAAKGGVTPKMQDLMDSYQRGDAIPPIPVYEQDGKYVLNKDGWNRYQAQKQLGTKNIEVQVQPKFEGTGTQKQAIERAAATTTAGSDFKPSTNLVGIVKSQLENGKSLEDVVGNHMVSTGLDLPTAASQVSAAAKEAGFSTNGRDLAENPLLGTVHIPQATTPEQAVLNGRHVQSKLSDLGNSALTDFKTLSTHDKLLLPTIEKDTVSNVAKQAENPEAFTQAAASLRTYFDTRHAFDHELGIDTNYRPNYIRHVFETAPASEEPFVAQGGTKNPGYTKQRTGDALVQDVTQSLEKDVRGATANLGSLTYQKGLEESLGTENVANAPVQNAEGKTFRQLQTFGSPGRGVFVNPDMADALNRRAPAAPATGGLKAYDTVNTGAKYVKLGGGTFHAMTEAGNFIGEQIATGNILRHPEATGRMFTVFFRPKAMDQAMETFAKAAPEGSVLDKASLSGLTTRPGEILADATTGPIEKAVSTLRKLNPIKVVHDATFQRQIPYAKIAMFDQKTQGLDIHNPADMAKMRQVAQGVNALFGGINRSVDGLTPQTAKKLSRFLLATDFTESKVTTLMNAIKSGGEQGKLARQAVVGKAVLFASTALGADALLNNEQGKPPTDVALDFVGKLFDPSFTIGKTTVSLPDTHISEFSRPLTSFFNGDTDPFYGLKHYASARLAAVPSEAVQLATNRDYTGKPIYGTQSKSQGGQPISPGKVALNIASGVLPIPGAQAVSALTGQQSIPAAIANTVGLRTYPTPNQAVQDYYKVYAQISTNKQKTNNRIDALIKPGQPLPTNQIQRIVKEWNASVDQQAAPLKAKYGDKLDAQIKSLKLSPEIGAIKRRQDTQKKNQKLQDVLKSR